MIRLSMAQAQAGGWLIEFRPRRVLYVRAPDGSVYRRARGKEAPAVELTTHDTALVPLRLVLDKRGEAEAQRDLFVKP